MILVPDFVSIGSFFSDFSLVWSFGGGACVGGVEFIAVEFGWDGGPLDCA